MADLSKPDVGFNALRQIRTEFGEFLIHTEPLVS